MIKLITLISLLCALCFFLVTFPSVVFDFFGLSRASFATSAWPLTKIWDKVKSLIPHLPDLICSSFFLLLSIHDFFNVSWWQHPLYDMEGDIGGSEHQNTAKNLANSAILPRKSLNTTILHHPSLPMSCQNHHSVHYIWS